MNRYASNGIALALSVKRYVSAGTVLTHARSYTHNHASQLSKESGNVATRHTERHASAREFVFVFVVESEVCLDS